MEKITLKLHEVLKLSEELVTILKEKAPAQLKFKLYKIEDKIKHESEIFEKAKLELFKKFGTQEDDKILIAEDVLPSFNEEFSNLLLENFELEYTPIPQTFFDGLVVEGDIKILSKLISE